MNKKNREEFEACKSQLENVQHALVEAYSLIERKTQTINSLHEINKELTKDLDHYATFSATVRDAHIRLINALSGDVTDTAGEWTETSSCDGVEATTPIERPTDADLALAYRLNEAMHRVGANASPLDAALWLNDSFTLYSR